MKKIKFRGKTEEGKYIFSDSIQFDVDGKGREFCRLKDEYGNWLYVAPYSVAQLIGYDKNDKEVYSDDILTDGEFEVNMETNIAEYEDRILEYLAELEVLEEGGNDNL